jgi:hypothetical protein
MTFTCLTQIYTPLGLLRDGDGDGLPDGFGVRFVVGRTPGAVDVAARLGLETAAYTPGFTADTAPGVVLYFGPGNEQCPAVAVPPGCGLVALTEAGVVVTGDTPDTGWMAARWLAETFPYTAPGGPLLAELSSGRIISAVVIKDGAVVDVKLGSPLASAASDKPVLVGPPAEAPFAAAAPGDLPPPGPARLFTVAGLLGSSDSACHDRAGWQVAVDSAAITPEEVAGLCELAARTGVEATGLCFPVAVPVPAAPAPGTPRVTLTDAPPAAPDWTHGHLSWTADGLTVSGTPAERAAALREAAESGLVDGIHATLFTRRAALPEQALPPRDILFDLALEQEWEVDRFLQTWRMQVIPKLKPRQPVAVDLRISEPLGLREVMAQRIAADLQDAGVVEASIRVLSAYKQGFHWLEEEILPRLQAAEGLARVTVSCARFESEAPKAAPEGLGAGVAPQSGSGGELRGPEGLTRNGAALELPIRWLQELYPVDELLSQKLDHAPVEFTLADEAQADIYQLTAYRADGSMLMQAGFSPVHAARDYLPEFPLRGRVHPPTGLLRVTQGGRTLAETAIDTDAEAFWTAYQEQVLPRLRQHIIETCGPAPEAERQPFFGALVIEAGFSEDDRRLGIRQEMISPLDAMHEDLYFYTLDYLNELGLSLTGTGWPAPGAVEPWIKFRSGGPVARVRLYARPAVATATADQLPESVGALPATPADSIPMDVVIGPEQLPPYLAYLAGLPGVRVWRTGLSFAGRATWALSVTAPTAGRIAPPQKLSAWRPTFLVNARRHANEVSSTNSILKLAELAATQGWTRRVNLVLSPMENADGAAIHYAMQQVHPTWKLHAARFNAAGVDFGFDCFSPEPRFGEARTLPTLWRNFLPDVVLDDHGYPANEWVQPFSGWNSPPYFKTSWWMPNALIYGIHRWMDAERFPANAAAQEEIRAALAERLVNDPEIAGYTEHMLERYVTYGQRYVPEKFPLQQHKGFVSQFGKVAAGPDARTFVGRFPHITAAELVTEVPDETAQGDYLALCARAHLEGDLAILNLLAERPQPVVRRRWEEGGRVCWSVGRERPFRVS